MSAIDEEHAQLMLSNELGVEFRRHDDGSKPGMPDLLSVDGKHVAEVITTASRSVRKAEKNLPAVSEVRLPHCVWVLIPYTVLGGATKGVLQRITADVLRWIEDAGCDDHWSSNGERQSFFGSDTPPFLGLREYNDGIQVMCVQFCQHRKNEHHQIKWSVVHEPTPVDPWGLLQRSLGIVEKEQRGGVQALAKKLGGYPNKHLVMYPFGSPGNVTAAVSDYVLPSDLGNLAPPRLHPPLVDVHLWILYRYGKDDITGGLHVCDNHWRKFGTQTPQQDKSSFPWRLHHPDA
ncbi:hypothetical protein [Arthrobacter pityocampae]|uniref:hypothetical protein n=1 Tax=Arthrobacter pityocampae TaxID=547334 RepID=UPI0037352AFC